MVYLWKLFFFLKIGNRCHLIFATDAQLLALSGAKNWYVDGTFKLCKALFTQLLTVNAFVQSEDHAKQVPLVFTLMSGKKKKDYRAVLLFLLVSPHRTYISSSVVWHLGIFPFRLAFLFARFVIRFWCHWEKLS